MIASRDGFPVTKAIQNRFTKRLAPYQALAVFVHNLKEEALCEVKMKTLHSYRMPAEWEPQDATWLSWPWNPETWPDNLADTQAEFEKLVLAIAADQNVNLLTPGVQLGSVKDRFSSISNVAVIEMETNDAWARDYAPTFVVDSDAKLSAIDWYYNGWGEKYPPFIHDQHVAKKVADHLGIRHVAGGLCLEGGAIEINAQGTLITTESCVLNSNRNAGLSKHNAEAIFREKLGCKRVIWLPGDIERRPAIDGDDTDGHVDQLVRFVDDETVVHAWVAESDSRFASISANVDQLKHELPQVNFVPLVLPPIEHRFGRAIPASYCNFIITNDSVILPQFGSPEDDGAVSVLESIFNDRRVIPLNSVNLSVGLGSFHCLSQQQPVAPE